jgi:TPR repeat protein
MSSGKNARRELAGLKARAAGGEVEAQAELGDRHSLGDGVRRSRRLARQWYELAARRGSSDAMAELAVFLGRGLGGPSDRRRANRLYRRAAGLGNRGAMGNLGFVLKNGLGTRKDPKRAFHWFWRAAELGDVDSLLELPHLIDAHGFRHDRGKLAQLFEKAARSGDCDAMTTHGVNLFEGRGIGRDRAAAMRWYKRAARLGSVKARYNLGQMYRRGHATRQSWPRALACYRKAARDGHEMSCLQLAWYYEETAKNPRLHLRWLREAVRRGIAQAQCDLGVDYINGDGVRSNKRRGAQLYAAAASQGHAQATYLLGLCHRDGLGVTRDLHKARRWFERAIRLARKDGSDGVEIRTEARAALRALKAARRAPRKLERAR